MSAVKNSTPAPTGVRPITLARLAATAFLATVLALSSTVSFAAFTANATLSGTATTTGLEFSSAGLPNLSVTFAKKVKLANAWVTFTNTGPFPLLLTSIRVANTGSEALGSETEFHVWADTKCEKKAPGSAVETTLSSGTTAIASSYGFAIPVGGSLTLCTDVQFKGKLKELAGHSVASAVTFTAAATSGAPTWTTTDIAAPVVTISVVGFEPSSVACAPGSGYVVGGVRYSSVVLTWEESTVQKPDHYEVWANNVLVATTDDKVRTIELNSSRITATGELEVTIVAVKDDIGYDSEVVYINSTAGAAARNITCA